MSDILPIACDLTRLTDEARARETQLLAGLRSRLRNPVSAGEGWRYELPSDGATLAELGELLALERLCCPFLSFTLSVDASRTAMLTISGPEGSAEFISKVFAPTDDTVA